MHLRKSHKTKKSATKKIAPIPFATVLNNESEVSVATKKNLQSMYPYMPPVDVTFLKTILK